MKSKLKIALIIIGIILAPSASASGLKVTPSLLKFEAVSGKTGQKNITIENPGSDVALFEIYPDEFSGQISIDFSSFTLNPKEKKELLVSANFKEEGVYVTFLSVVSSPLSKRKFETNAGVKIPLEIRVLQNKSGLWTASLLESLKKLFSKQQNLIYIYAIILILFLVGFKIFKGKNDPS